MAATMPAAPSWPALPYGSICPASSPGDWNRPSIDIRKPMWEMHNLRGNFFSVDGAVDLDARFFRTSRGAIQPHAICVALTTPDMEPMEWNHDEGPFHNPRSFIEMGGRITIDQEFTSVKFTIHVPKHLLPPPGGMKVFNVAVKAALLSDKSVETKTNVAQFAVCNRMSSRAARG